jgi:hypothetical protein
MLTGFISSCNKPKLESGIKESSAPAPQAVVPQKGLNTGHLIGKWARTDGNYVLEIKSMPSTGYPDVAYFNPNPIKVGNAQVIPGNGAIKVFVKLDDPEKGYPGCTYQLGYNKETDMLEGVYFQAASNQEYSISFARMK